MRKFLLLFGGVFIFLSSVVPVLAQGNSAGTVIDCNEGLNYVSVDKAENCKDEFKNSDDIAACETFLNQHSNEDLIEACVVTKNYELPALPRPDGIPIIAQEDLADVRDVRSFFINQFFPRVTRLLIWGIGLVGFVMVLYGGFRYFTTFGKEEYEADAKQAIVYALIGVAVAFLSFAIIQIIGTLPF